MKKIFKDNFIVFGIVLAVPAFCAGAEPIPFDKVYQNISLVKTLFPGQAPAVSPAGEKGFAARALNGAAPELAYENLLVAPLWKAPAAAAAAAVDLGAGFSPARHQGSRNLCNAFAAVGLAEYLVGEKEKNKPDFSEEFSYYNTKLKFTDTPALNGYKKEPGLPGYATVDALRGGVVAEKEWPFLAALPAHTPVPPLTDPDLGLPPPGVAQKVLGYGFKPVAIRRSEIKNFLSAQRRPVVMNLMLYTGNIDNASGRLADPSGAQRRQCFTAGDNCGGHVVLLTGYDPAAKEYIFRNSWGAGWGAAGYGRVSEKYVAENCEACHYLADIPGMGQGMRALTVNASYGWSAELK
ncbi:MAG TPA: C1 family peptidase [Elusimicrobiales bacterium]|nr:C1 family peptidase [Elusimicrobiales bacterium]